MILKQAHGPYSPLLSAQKVKEFFKTGRVLACISACYVCLVHYMEWNGNFPYLKSTSYR